ncbi:MAG: hypothetical protein GYB67_06965 [Chloroflexi bacterium]|nr:hypothetical protein [Chloroflexota bacterium]
MPTPVERLPGWARQRLITLTAVASTAVVLCFVTSRAPEMAEVLWRDYGLAAEALPLLYAALLILTLAACAFEPQLRRELRDGRALVIGLAGVIAVAAMQLNGPGQVTRLYQYPLTLWLVIAHLVALSGLLALLVVARPLAPPEPRLLRYAVIAAVGWGVALSTYHVVSVGRYMLLDTPDEAELGSLAISAAAGGVLDRVYIASAFGTPDPVAPYYYLLMGGWLHTAGVSLETLRGFPLMVGVAAALITGAALWRWTPRSAAIIAWVGLLSFSGFVRTTHNLRQDIGLAVFGALLLIALLGYWEGRRQRAIWLLAGGLSLYSGLETIPTAALTVAAVVGLVIAARTRRFRPLLLYGLGCGVALGVYGFTRFVLDPTGWERFTDYFAYYRALGNFRGGVDRLVGYYGRFNLILAPAELLTISAAVVAVICCGTPTQRWVVVTAIGGLLALILGVGGSYGYLALFAPFIAYVLAVALRWRVTVIVGAFVLLPALAAAPLRDMAVEIDADLNRRLLAEVDLLSWQIPAGAAVVGDDVFWFTLGADRAFVGWNGLKVYAGVHDLDLAGALNALAVDVAICFEVDVAHCAAAEAAGFAPPTEFVITRGRYWVYQRAVAAGG